MAARGCGVGGHGRGVKVVVVPHHRSTPPPATTTTTPAHHSTTQWWWCGCGVAGVLVRWCGVAKRSIE